MRTTAALALLFAVAAGAAPASAETSAAQIAGDWRLMSFVTERGVARDEPYGPHPDGFLTFSTGGRFTFQVFRPDLPKVASGNRFTATPEESVGIARFLLSYFGSWKLINAATGEILLHVEASSFGNWNGTDQPRYIGVEGDVMTLKIPAGAAAGASTLLLKKVD